MRGVGIGGLLYPSVLPAREAVGVRWQSPALVALSAGLGAALLAAMADSGRVPAGSFLPRFPPALG